MAYQLSSGSVSSMFDNRLGDGEAVVQVLNIKKISPQQGAQQPVERFRLIISDGQHYIQAMVATNLNQVLVENVLQKNGIIRVNKCVTNQVQGRKIVIILEMNVLTPNEGNLDKIGAPANIDPTGEQANQQQAQAQAQAPAPQQQQHQAPQHYQQPQQQNNGFGQNQNRPSYGGAGPSGYGGNQAQGQAGGGGIGGMSAHGPISPINALNPYNQRWTICARAANKTDVKTWSNQRGEGKLFSVTFLDESGEIRATAFNDQCTKYYDQIQDGNVYYISKAEVKQPKQSQYSTGTYEIHFKNDTVVEKSADGGVGIPAIRHNFVSIADIAGYEKDQTVDVIGVVKELGEVQQIISKTTQKPLEKRDLTIVDDSNQSIRLTLWGKQAMQFNHQGNPVVAIKNARVGDFGGRSLSALSSSTISVDPDIPECHRLTGWYQSGGQETHFHSFAGQTMGGGGRGKDVSKTIAQIKDENLGQGDKPDYFNLRGTIVFIRHTDQASSFSYPACPTEGCNKKLVEEGAMAWRCEKCQQTFEAPNYRYILGLNVSDHTGQTWLSAFNEQALPILGNVSANELVALKDQDQTRYEQVVQSAVFKTYNFKVRAKMENYQDEQKVKLSVVSATPVDYAELSHQLLETIAQYGVVFKFALSLDRMAL